MLFGSCPDYRVAISGDGTVRFSSREWNTPRADADVHRMFNGESVLWEGPHETMVDPAAVAALVEKFRAAHFMGLQAQYEAGITDSATMC
jgi:hypothetical protein